MANYKQEGKTYDIWFAEIKTKTDEKPHHKQEEEKWRPWPADHRSIGGAGILK